MPQLCPGWLDGARLELKDDRLILPVPDELCGRLVSSLEGLTIWSSAAIVPHPFPGEAGDDVSRLETPRAATVLVEPCRRRRLLSRLEPSLPFRMLGRILFCIRCQDSEGWTLRAGELFRELANFR